MSKKIKFVAHLKINVDYDGDFEYKNEEELCEKVTQIVTDGIWEISVKEVEEEEKENV